MHFAKCLGVGIGLGVDQKMDVVLNVEIHLLFLVAQSAGKTKV